ncbi:MAG: D-2-hydroxyacid dehydrogenase [Opitutales bacterium]|nr:D-2-hydroxyacid dehydrogenase [Opitutales bacterium]
MDTNILVTLPMTDADRRRLTERAVNCRVRTSTPPGATAEDLGWADCVLGNLKPPAVLERYPNIRWIHTPNVGLDAYAPLAESRPDLKITNIRGIADHPVSDHVLALLLTLARALPRVLHTAGNPCNWGAREDYGPHCMTLAGKNVHVLGYGSIARCLVRKLAGFDGAVTVYRRRGEGNDPHVARFRALGELTSEVREADVLINLLPSLPETRCLVGAPVFAAMRADALFINAGRGSTVDEPALIDVLKNGRLCGAALDVFTEEPLPEDSPLWSLPNVILTPHVAGRFDGEMRAHIDFFFDSLERVASADATTP